MALPEELQSARRGLRLAHLKLILHLLPHLLLLIVIIEPKIELAIVLIMLLLVPLHLFVCAKGKRIARVPVDILFHLVSIVKQLGQPLLLVLGFVLEHPHVVSR